MNKRAALLLVAVLALSSLVMGESAFAQSIARPSVPEFTMTFTDHSYDVAPTTSSTTNPYNNKTTTTTIPGYHVQNYTIDLTIKNQPYPATIDGNTSYLLYDVRMKGHYTNAWIENNPGTYLPHQSSSEYTVVSFPAVYRIGDMGGAMYMVGDEVDFQIRAILAYGYNFSLTAVYPVYSYDYIYVALSDWSPTQTITIPDLGSSSSSSSSSLSSTQDQTSDTSVPSASPSQNSTTTPQQNPLQPDDQTLSFDWAEIAVFAVVGVAVALLIIVVAFLCKRLQTLERKIGNSGG